MGKISYKCPLCNEELLNIPPLPIWPHHFGDHYCWECKGNEGKTKFYFVKNLQEQVGIPNAVILGGDRE